jgi:MFS family permease
VAGQAADRLGRRYVIIAAAVVFIIGALASAAAPGLAVLIIARILLGVAVGLASANAPVYISEVAPPESRGRLVSYFQLSVTVGILVAYLVGLAFSHSHDWRWMLGLGAVPALALGIGMLEMPQSPRWLVMVGQDYAARKVLEKIRRDDEEAITEELEEIKGSIDAKPGTWRDLLEPAVRAALLVGVGLAVLQQVTGINTVIYYAPTIIQFTGVNSASSAILASLGVGVVNIVMTVVALRLIDRKGRSASADGRRHRHGDRADGAGSVLPLQRRHHPDLRDRDHQPDELRGRLRNQPGSDLLADELGDLSAEGPEQGCGCRNDGELDLELHHLAHLPPADRPPGPHRRLLGVCGRRGVHALVLLEARPRDQGQGARADRGDLPRARR